MIYPNRLNSYAASKLFGKVKFGELMLSKFL